MPDRKLSRLEYGIMEALWSKGEASIRELQETLPEKKRPAYTTVQTTLYRLEAKGSVRRVRKVGNFHVFTAAVTRSSAQTTLIDELLSMFGGKSQPVMSHLVRSGKLTLEDIKEAEALLKSLSTGMKNDE